MHYLIEDSCGLYNSKLYYVVNLDKSQNINRFLDTSETVYCMSESFNNINNIANVLNTIQVDMTMKRIFEKVGIVT
jgi:hypothetical protein